jgi:hypothetical protein
MITHHLTEKKMVEIPTWGVTLFPMIGYKGMIPRRDMINMITEGALASMPTTLHHSDIISQRESDYSYEVRESN